MPIDQIASFLDSVFMFSTQIEISCRQFLPVEAEVRNVRHPLDHPLPGLSLKVESQLPAGLGTQLELFSMRRLKGHIRPRYCAEFRPSFGLVRDGFGPVLTEY